jgi:hypothetical protein
LTESLPAAALRPVLATATPPFSTSAFWVVSRPSAPLAPWLIVVEDSLPIAEASPVVTHAEPLLTLAASPLFELAIAPPVAVWSVVDVFSELLPTATLPPVLATATPTFGTTAVWVTTCAPPPPPEGARLWPVWVPDLLPTAVASPVPVVPDPSEAVPASSAWAAAAPITVRAAPPASDSARLRANRLFRSIRSCMTAAKVPPGIWSPGREPPRHLAGRLPPARCPKATLVRAL